MSAEANTYIVTGLIGYCIYGQWTETEVCTEVRAANTDAAKDLVLSQHQPIAESLDPQATIAWKDPPAVRRVKALGWKI